MNKLAPLTGVLFLVLAILAFAIGGEPPDITDDSAQEIVDFYADNEDSQMIGALLEGLAGTAIVFFAGYLRRVLRTAEGEGGGFLSAVAFAGAIIFATGLAIDGTISFALADAADDLDPASVQTLSALWSNDFLPFAMGMQLFLLATGIAVVRTAALPKWIGWIAIVLAVLAVTPIGFFAFLGGALLIGIMSVVLAMRVGTA